MRGPDWREGVCKYIQFSLNYRLYVRFWPTSGGGGELMGRGNRFGVISQLWGGGGAGLVNGASVGVHDHLS